MATENEILERIRSQDWDYLYPRLVAHAGRRLGWIGLNPKEGVLGYDPKNIVSSSIEKVLLGERLPQNTDFNDFLLYMKGVVNSLVYNLKAKKENRLKDARHLDGPLADEVFFESILEEGFLREDELSMLQESFEQELIKKDEDAFLVYSELCQGKKHKAIADSMNKQVSEVENIHRRLNTFIKNFRAKQ